MITQNLETLRNVSLDFAGTDEDFKTLISLLEFELKVNQQKGVGLSAIQINVPLRVAIIRQDKTVLNLFNAKIIKAEQPFTFKGEGCLSFPGDYHDTKRFNLVTIRNGNGEEIKLSGFLAVAAQHEMDHWDGVVFTDKVV
jgi:methionyl-tRNA formyltransferase